MTGARAAAGRAGAALAALLAVLLGLAVPAAPPAAAAGPGPADRVVVVGVPGLVWGDVDRQGTPELWSLAEQSAIGAMTVRSARSTTCLLDGWATLGAGNRARFPSAAAPIAPVPLPSPGPPTAGSPGEPAGPAAGAPSTGAPAADTDTGTGLFGPPRPEDTSLSYCGVQEQVAAVGLADPQRVVGLIEEDEATARFGAEPALLGGTVGCAGVVGRAATLAVAAPDAVLTRAETLPPGQEALTGLLGGCPLSVVSLDALTDAGQPSADETDTGTQPDRRAGALAEVDAAVGSVRAAVAALPGDTLLLLQGVSEVNDGRPQLHVAMAAGPGSGTGWLSSASTGRAPFVQLIDVAPTALAALGLEQPESMNGQPITGAGPRPGLAAAIEELEQANTRAVTHLRSTSDFFWLLVLVSAVVVGLGILTLGGWDHAPRRTPDWVLRWWRRHRPAAGARWRRWLRPLCLAAAALPIATYLAGLLPWQLAGSPRAALAGSVALAVVGVTAGAALGPWRRHPLGPAAAVLAVTLGTLVADVLTGSHLELDGLLGYDAIVAGRFTGWGNLTFGLTAVSALLLTAAAATAVGRRVAARGSGDGRRATLATVLGCGLVVVVLIGAPSLGRDFGGVLAAVPGFLLLAMLLGGIRVTAVRLVAVLAVAVLAVGTVAVLDWTRPAAERTHLGRFVAQLLDGQALTVVTRKAEANLGILLGSPLAYTLLVALVAAVWLLRPGGLLRLRSRPDRAPGGLPAADVRVLRAGLTTVALSLSLGAAVNDSGVAVPATAATLLLPLLVWLVAAPRRGRATATEPAAERVSVSARGSTGTAS